MAMLNNQWVSGSQGGSFKNMFNQYCLKQNVLKKDVMRHPCCRCRNILCEHLSHLTCFALGISFLLTSLAVVFLEISFSPLLISSHVFSSHLISSRLISSHLMFSNHPSSIQIVSTFLSSCLLISAFL